MDHFYTASKVRIQGQDDAWAVVFRHPLRTDTSGNPGRRVRRRLGTHDEIEAGHLVGQLNELLRNPGLWETSARSSQDTGFDHRVLDIFYDGREPTTTDFLSVRDEYVRLPGLEDGYRTVLMLGTTGAGKTTLVRQLLGTDPVTERFPSTSTAKTTVADTELIFTSGPQFQAVVTFVGRDEVIDYLTECVSEAGLAAARGSGDQQIGRRLLDHPNQRFRFSYILGRPGGTTPDDDIDDDDDDVDTGALLPETSVVDLKWTAEVIETAVEAIKHLAAHHTSVIASRFAPVEGDERVLEELVEEELDEAFRQDERFHLVVDSLFDEIEKRFDLLSVGSVTRNRQGWPISWAWQTHDRSDLIKAVTRFSSNYAPLFGTLLTPLVSGIRVAGPFAPLWASEPPPRLVIVDGEGLGHTPSSAAALSTSVSRRIELVDAVLLVDNATQPMQAAPVAAMKATVTSGNAKKLLFIFTHFDMVKGDNLPSFSEREAHVKASAENVLKAIGDDLGPYAERVLRQRLELGCFFIGGIDTELSPTKKAGQRTIRQLTALLQAIDAIVERPKTSDSRPVFDGANLILGVHDAAQNFHDTWQGRFGFVVDPDQPKEHWTRIKALSRRLAEGFADEYDTLKPVSELKRELDNQIYRMLQQPVRWNGPEPTDEEKQQLLDVLANAISTQVTEIATRRIKSDPNAAWRDAYAQAGKGSTFERARIISGDVYDRAAPVPSVTPSVDQNAFLHEITSMVHTVAATLSVELLAT